MNGTHAIQPSLRISNLLGFLVLAATAALATEVPFAPQSLIGTAPDGASAVFAADVDGDGDVDALSASNFADEITWYENRLSEPDPPSWLAHTIATGANGARSVVAADVDGDGDMDALSASVNDDKIAWYENDGTPAIGLWPAYTISTTANGPISVFAADVDGDGDVDALSASQVDNKIAWYKNDGTPDIGVWPAYMISSANLPFSVFAADVDGDGDVDVLSATFSDNQIAWYKNDGTPDIGLWSAHTIGATANGALSVFAADVDGDGDLDALSASQTDDKIAWYENDSTPDSGLWTARTISTAANGAGSVFAADVDGDGDLDALSASQLDDKIAWYENDGTPTVGPWTARTISTAADGATSVFAADVDGDGDIDVLSASRNDNEIAWYENRTIHGNAVFPGQSTISTAADGAFSVFAADVDGDGDKDVLSASINDGKIAWYENRPAADWPEYTINAAPVAVYVFAADVDGDGDMDALSASLADDKIAWYENDGTPKVDPWTPRAISTAAHDLRAVVAADVDGDGDMDALAATYVDGQILWYENNGIIPPDWTAHTINPTFPAYNASSVFAADVDGDGDVDALSASVGGIAWYENDGTPADEWTKRTIGTAGYFGRSVFAADMDGDGDVDALSASVDDNNITWYENRLNRPELPPWPEHTISTAIDGARSVFAADVDGDGDVDALSASEVDNKIAWYENNGAVTPWTAHTIDTAAIGAHSVFAADLDGDGDMDALSASYNDDKIAWYENRGGQFGLVTTDSAPATIFDEQVSPILTVTLTHNGRPGDTATEWASLDLLFEETAGDPLSSVEANALFDAVEIYRDNGSGQFELGFDALVASVDSLTLTPAGYEQIVFTDGGLGVDVMQGTPGTFFVVVRMASSASSGPVGSFRITHPQSSSTAEDRDRDILLRQEFALTVSSSLVNVSSSALAGRVPDGDDVPGVPLTLNKSAGNLTLSWGASCRGSDSDYAVYEGALGNFTSHVQKLCSTGGVPGATITPGSGNSYYLVVPLSPDGVEGSYGTASNGTPRPASASACFPQQFAACP